MRCRWVFALLLTIFCRAEAVAQVATGVPAFNSFSGGPFDTIDLGDLNVHFQIPIMNKSGRGMPFWYVLSYDSSMWMPGTVNGQATWVQATNGGWTSQSNGLTGSLSSPSSTTYCYGTNGYPDGAIVTVAFTYHDVAGTAHDWGTVWTMYNGSCSGTNVTTYSGSNGDGSGLTLTADQSGSTYVTTPAGTILQPNSLVQDRNGNQITSNGSGTFYDTLNGTTPVLTFANAASSSDPSYNSETDYTYQAPAGPATIKVFSNNVTLQANFGCGYAASASQSSSLIQKILFPDGSYYLFSYEPTSGAPAGYYTGRVASVRLPTSGTVSYSYTGTSCSDGSTTGLTRITPDDASQSQHWNYSRSGSGSSSTTTVIDPASSTTTINFSGLYETQRVVKDSGNSTLSTVVTCYNGQTNPSVCPTATVNGPITQKNVFMQTGGSSVYSQVQSSFNTLGLPTDEYDYDYYNGSQYPLLRHTHTDYASLGNNISGQPSQVSVYDGAGNLKAQTRYTYDEYTADGSGHGALQSTSAPQHAAVSGSRGNVTTISRLVSGSTYLSQYFGYFDTGNVQNTFDVNGAQTTSTYGACGDAFATNVAEPLSLSRSMAWDCNGGVSTSLIDENGQSTSNAYTNPYFYRVDSSKDELQNQTTFTYGANPPTTVESAMNFNGSTSTSDTLSTADGLGRAMLSQQRQSQGSSNFDSIETDYDVLGRPTRVPLPYVGAAGANAGASAPAVTTNYDALSRVIQQADAGGGFTSYSYSGRDVLVTVGPAAPGENPKRRQLEFDALGRLTSVCEITSSIGYGVCAQDSSQSGYWTKYTYDTLDHLIGVTQNAQGVSQSRSYTYDSLGRMTSENTPESGTVTYIYDSVNLGGCQGSNPGDLVMKTDAAGNGSCYVYDALHRVKSIGQSYAGSPNASVTPDKCFNYDSATVNGIAMSNTKGRLAEAYTVAQGTGCGAAKITDDGFSYSPRGELTDIYESTPHSGGYYHVSQSYWANGAVNTISGLGLPTLTYAVDGEGRNNTVSASSGQSPITQTGYNVAGSPTSVTFGSGDSDSFAYDANTNRMTQYKVTVGSSPQSIVGGLTWNPNGSLAKLSIADPFNSANQQTCLYSSDDLSRVSGVDCGSAPVENYASTQSNGNFGVYNQAGTALWTTGTTQSGPAPQFPGLYEMTMQDDGNAVLYHPMWANWGLQSSVSGPFPAPNCSSMGTMLDAGQQLTVGKCLVSASGRFYLTLQSDGNFVEYDLATNPPTPRWSSVTQGQTVSYATMQSDGNFVLYGPTGNAVWNTGTWLANPDPQYPGAYLLEMQNDGNAVIYHPLWSSGTVQGAASGPFAAPDCDNRSSQLGSGDYLAFGECLVSQSGRFELKMQADGNFVLYDLAASPIQALWSAGTTSAGSVVWSQSFNYDSFGNVSKSGTGAYQPTYSSATNHITSLPGFAPSYDGNGNLLSDGSHSYAWDAAGNLIGIDSTTKTFDALGRLVEINRSGSYQQVVYSPSAGKLAIMAGQSIVRAYVPLPGGATAVYGSGGVLSYYRHPDWLGSSRFASTPSRTMYYDGAYAPFGDAYAEAGTTDRAFTGQDQDTVPGLNDFLYREHSPTQGRWLSPDPYMGSMDLTNPQSLNRYAYVNNNPVNAVDPLGLQCVTLSNGVVADDGTQPPCGSMTPGNGQPDATVDGSNLSSFYYWLMYFANSFYDPPKINWGGSSSGGGGAAAPAPPAKPAPSKAKCGSTGPLPHSLGLSAGANADAGALTAGSTSTASVGFGVFRDKNTGLSAGAFAAGGAAAYFGPLKVGAPAQQVQPISVGLYAGAGPSLWISNASSVQQLSGPFTTISVNFGAGPVKGSAQVAYSGGIWQLSVGPPIPYLSAGTPSSSVTRLTTTTVTTNTGCTP